MAEFEEKLNAVLNDPKMMQQLMSMAQSISGGNTAKEESFPEIDPGMLKRLSMLTSQGSIDRNQQTLLRALHPYLTKERIRKLEKAMRAARMAKMASGMLNSGALQL